MRTRHDLTAAKEQPHDLGHDFKATSQRPVSLRGKVFCGLLAGVIVMTVSSAFDRSYDTAEAAGATQVILAEAEADAQTRGPKVMRGVSGMASAKHDWVFDN